MVIFLNNFTIIFNKVGLFIILIKDKKIRKNKNFYY